MINQLKNSTLLLLIAWLASACVEQTIYHSYQPIPRKGWGKSDTLVFNVPITDSLKTLELFAEVRNESQYTYQNLFLVVSHNLQDSTVFKADTLELTLADKEGKWLGTGWGSLFQSVLPAGTAVSRYRGNYTIKVSQGMKDDYLIGISDVGVRITTFSPYPHQSVER